MNEWLINLAPLLIFLGFCCLYLTAAVVIGRMIRAGER